MACQTKMCVQDGRFECNIRYKRSKKKYNFSPHKCQKSPQTPEMARKLDLIMQKHVTLRSLQIRP